MGKFHYWVILFDDKTYEELVALCEEDVEEWLEDQPAYKGKRHRLVDWGEYQ